MATQFINEFEAYKSGSGRLADIFVSVRLGSNLRHIPLSQIVVYVNDSTFRHISSLNEFNRLLNKQKADGEIRLMAVDGNNNPLFGSSVDNDTQLYTRTNEIPEIFVSRDLNGVRADGSEDKVEYGLKRAVEIKKSTNFNNNDQYVYVELANDSNMKFIKKDQIGYYDAGRFRSLKDLVDADPSVDLLAVIRDKDLYTVDNIYVTKIFSSSTCSVGEVKARERIDIPNLKIHSFNIDEKGNITTTDLDIDTKYSEQFAYKKDNQALLDISNYEANNQHRGDYIKVIFKGESSPTLVPIDNLYLKDSAGVGEHIDKEVFLSNPSRYVEQSLYFVPDTEDMTSRKELEPLTVEQANLIYDNVYTMQVNSNADAVMRDGTYLRLKDGRYIEENKSVRPNCYDFVGLYDTDFDAYFVLFEPTSDFKGMIVSKDAFSARSSIIERGKELKLANAIKIKLSSKPMIECDLIQTSSTNQVAESAELLNKPNLNNDGTIAYLYTGFLDKIERSQEEKTQTIKDANADFIEKYKNGQYILDKVVDDEGKFADLDQQKNRYSLSAIITRPDSANELNEYKYFSKNKLTYDARTKRFTGGPKYNTREAIGREMAKGLKNIFVATGLLFSLGGVFALTIAPFAVAGVFAGLVAYPIGKSIIEVVKGYRINRRDYKYKDRVEENRKQFSKEVNEELNELYFQTKDKLDQVNYEFVKEHFKRQILESSDPAIAGLRGSKLQSEIDKRIREMPDDEYRLLTQIPRGQYIGAFLDRMKKIEEKKDNFATTKYYADFQVVDGRAEVTPANAYLFSKYREEMSALEKDIKRLRRGAKTDPNKRALLESKVREYQVKTMNYQSLGKECKRDPRFDIVDDKINLMKGLMIFKEFGDIFEQEEKFKDYFTPEEKDFISHLDYNPEKNQFTYDGKVFNTTNSINQTISHKKQKKFVPVDKIVNTVSQKICDYGKDMPTYLYEKGNTLIKSANFEIDKDTINTTTETEVAPVAPGSEVAPVAPEMVAPTPPAPKNKTGKRSSTMTKLTPKRLETLLDRISELGELDKQYFGPDEDMSNDIDDKIKDLENLIREDLHLLKSAGASSSDRYVKYKRRIVIAEMILKQHRLMNEKRAKINVSAKI